MFSLNFSVNIVLSDTSCIIQYILYCISGCKFHPGCCIPDDSIENAPLKMQFWLMKKHWMETNGELHVMRECEWRNIVSTTPEGLLPKTDIPRILLEDTKSKFHF